MSDASKDGAALHPEKSKDGEAVKEARAGEGGGGKLEEAVSAHGEEEQEEGRLDDGVSFSIVAVPCDGLLPVF